jgi:hypothetical protein
MKDIREDNLDAYRWILNDMNKAIGEELDTQKIAILGWSAGGTSLLYLVSPSTSPPSHHTNPFLTRRTTYSKPACRVRRVLFRRTPRSR